MEYGSKKALLSKGTERRFKEFEIPGCGVYRVRSMTERERGPILKEYQEDPTLVRARTIQLCAVDKKGNRIFGDGKGELEEILGLGTAYTQAFEDAMEELNKLGAREGNSEATQDASSP